MMRHSSIYPALVVASALLPTAEAATRYAKVNGLTIGDCDTWANACTLARAIDVAIASEQVWVAAGTYNGTVNLKSGVKIYGGFAGTETAASQSNPEANLTIITGNGNARAVRGDTVDANTVLRGFRITGGVVASDKCGAGLEIIDSLAVIAVCDFTNNRAGLIGAGACIDGGSPKFVNCKFRDHAPDDQPCNEIPATSAAGGVFIRDAGTPTFVNCLLYNNYTEEGGAAGNLSGEPKFINCTFVNNRAMVRQIPEDCSTHFAGNGAALFDNPGKATLHNCIVWHTISESYGENLIYNNPTAGSTTTVTHSDILTGWSGTGNINADPQFMDAANNDFRLSGPFSSTSPCRNTGNNSYITLPAVPDWADLDWDGRTDGSNGQPAQAVPFDLTGVVPRIWQTTVDMGAYEWKKETQQQMSAPPGTTAPDASAEQEQSAGSIEP